MTKTVILVVSLFLISAFSSCSSIVQERFNLNFNYSDSTDFVWISGEVTKPLIDSCEFVNGRYPIYYEGGKLFGLFPDDFNHFYLLKDLSQTFITPSLFAKGNDLEISLHNKCVKMDAFHIKVSGFDKDGNLTKTDSLDVNNQNEWIEKSFNIHLENIEYFTVSLLGKGELTIEECQQGITTKPRLYLDKMTIKIGGVDINEFREVNNLENYKKEKLNASSVSPVSSFEDVNFLKSIGLDGKSVVALGETVHGSKEIHETVFQIAKNAVLYNNCKLILLESEVASFLKINLFVQGVLPESEIANIREEERKIHLSMPVFVDFLLWLREYNKRAERKVAILGLLDNYEYMKSPLYDPVFAFYKEENKKLLLPLLYNLHEKKIPEAMEWVKKHTPALKQLMGETNFWLFYHTLENLEAMESGEKDLNWSNYDYHMWLNAKAFISMYPQNKETTLIIAHYGHVRKKEGEDSDLAVLNMGNNLYR